MLSNKNKDIIISASKAVFSNGSLKAALVEMVKDFRGQKKENSSLTFVSYVEETFQGKIDINNVKRMLSYYNLTSSGKSVKRQTPKALNNLDKIKALWEKLTAKEQKTFLTYIK